MLDLETSTLIRMIATIVLGASGTWLLLPHRHGRLKPRAASVVGAILATVALVALATLWAPPGDLIAAVFFYAFGLTALAAAVLTIVSRDPVYSALWFAAVVMATSGLFLLSGAQFLAAGTIIVYAGAIIVTFLFVIMLAQREGRATYDRMARSPGRATLTCFLLFWSLLAALVMLKAPSGRGGRGDDGEDYRLVRGSKAIEAHRLQPGLPVRTVINKALSPTNRLPESEPTAEADAAGPAAGRHVAALGATLYTDHLVTVEVAGALLFVALIGAMAIAPAKPPTRPSRTTTTAD